jgi:hypothetical protein
MAAGVQQQGLPGTVHTRVRTIDALLLQQLVLVLLGP